MGRPILGWSGYGRNRVYDEWGRDETLTDGFWVIVIGQQGWLGLLAAQAFMLLPGLLLWRRYSADVIVSPFMAPVTALTIVVTMFAIDCLFNYMQNPFYALAIGALIGLPRLTREDVVALSQSR